MAEYNLSFHKGAMFDWIGIFCKDCGCQGKSSKIDGSGDYIFCKKGESIKNWNAGIIEISSWKREKVNFDGFKIEGEDD